MLEKAPTDQQWSSYLESVWSFIESRGSEDEVMDMYLALSGRPAKARARNLLQDMTTDLLDNGRGDEAKRVVELRNALRDRRWGRAADTPRIVSKTEKYLEHVGALQLAFGICATLVPDDISERLGRDWLASLPTDNTQAMQYRAWLLADPDTRGPEPVMDEIHKRAARVSLGRAPGRAGRPPAIRRRRN